MDENAPPIDIEMALAAAAHALVEKRRHNDAALLASAEVTIEEDGYDNWNGGTIIWKLSIRVPYPAYIAVEEAHRSELEKFLNDVIEPFLPDTGHWLQAKILPAEFKDPNWRRNVVRQANDSIVVNTKQHINAPPGKIHAFISYQTKDKRTAGEVQKTLEEAGVSAFLAHEDIEVSVIWRDRILEELRKADIFVSILSKNYALSAWCVQESGIAAYRGITSMHLSLDGTIPEGFSGNVQSTKISKNNISILDLLPGLFNSDLDLGIEVALNNIGRSVSFRDAEANFSPILPYIDRMNDSQVKLLLEKSAKNGQVHHAMLCASEFIPPILESHGHLLDEKTRKFLKDVCEQYG